MIPLIDFPAIWIVFKWILFCKNIQIFHFISYIIVRKYSTNKMYDLVK